MGFALRRDLAHQNIAGAHFGTDEGDARFVQLGQRRVAHIGDVGRNLLRSQLGVAGYAGQLFDVDGREAVFLDHTLGDQDGVFEVVAVPGHESHQQVLAERELAQIRRRTVGEHVAALDRIARPHQRTLVDAGVLVGTRVLGERIDVDAGLAGRRFIIVHPYHDARGIDGIHAAAAARDHGDAGIDGHRPFHAGAHEGRFRAQGRNRLALHVRTHEGAVGVVVFEERNQGRRHRHDLLRRHVHVMDLIRRRQGELVLGTAGNQIVGELALFVEGGVRLGDHVLALFNGRQIVDLIGHLAARDAAVRSLKEPVVVGACVDRQRIDQPDVRAFRRFDRAHPAVVRGMHVAHFETGALARQAARAQCGNAAFVRDFRQRIVLVHELRELRGTEEFLHRRRHRLRVDHLLRHDGLALGDGQPLLDGALDAHQADAEGVLRHFADAAHAAVAQVIDVVHVAIAVADVDQGLHDLDDVFLAEHARARDLLAAHAAVELHAADRRQVVAFAVEEQILEQVLRGVLGRRLAGAHHAVDFDQCLEARLGRIDAQGVRDIRATVQIVDVQRADFRDAAFDELAHRGNGQDFIGLGQDLAGFGVDDVVRQHLALHIFRGHGQALDPRLFEFLHVARGDAAAFLDDDLLADANLERGRFAAQTLRDHLEFNFLLRQVEHVLVEEDVQHLLLGVAESAQDDGHGQLAAAVDAREDAILRVELEVQPRTAIGNDAGGEQQLAGRVRLAAVVIEEHAGAAVQLRHDDPLGTVDDEGAVVGHERQLAQIYFLLTHVFDGLLGAARFLVEDDEAHLDPQRSRVGQSAQLAFLDVEYRLAQAIAYVLESGIAGIAGNGEDAVESGMQADFVALGFSDIGLQESPVRIQLDRQQVRRAEDARTLAKVLPDAFLFGERIGH